MCINSLISRATLFSEKFSCRKPHSTRKHRLHKKFVISTEKALLQSFPAQQIRFASLLARKITLLQATTITMHTIVLAYSFVLLQICKKEIISDIGFSKHLKTKQGLAKSLQRNLKMEDPRTFPIGRLEQQPGPQLAVQLDHNNQTAA